MYVIIKSTLVIKKCIARFLLVKTLPVIEIRILRFDFLAQKLDM